MIAYRRFIPRQEHPEDGAAKLAKPAKVEDLGGVGLAKPALKPAKVDALEARGPDFSSPLAELSQPEHPVTLHFSRFSNFSGGAAPSEAAGPPDPILAAWAKGVARLTTMAMPNGYPSTAWQRVLDDAEQFMDRWSRQAAALGWRDWDVWGVHRLSPWRRIDGMGLVPLLRGSRLSALTEHEAVIFTTRGARQTHRRRPHDPLRPAQRALLWELPA